MNEYKSSIDCFNKIVKRYGISKGLFKGMTASFWREGYL